MSRHPGETTQLKARVIKQLVLAANFGAIFLDEEGGEPWVDTVCAWALISESPMDGSAPTESVIGMVADGKEVVFVDEFPNFAGYLSPDDSLDQWKLRVSDEAESRRNRF